MPLDTGQSSKKNLTICVVPAASTFFHSVEETGFDRVTDVGRPATVVARRPIIVSKLPAKDSSHSLRLRSFEPPRRRIPDDQLRLQEMQGS
jgi:hypothetical protein